MQCPSLLVPVLCLSLAACGGAQGQSEAPADPEPAAEPAPAPSSPVEPSAGQELTAEECEASGGTVVGDIGDGAIHRPDYRCPSGAPPSGGIRTPEGGPIGVEGSVCCLK